MRTLLAKVPLRTVAEKKGWHQIFLDIPIIRVQNTLQSTCKLFLST